jgi:hypothetical protein
MTSLTIKRVLWWGNVCIFFVLVLHACRTERLCFDSKQISYRYETNEIWKSSHILNETGKDFFGEININDRIYKSTSEIVEQIRSDISILPGESELKKAWYFVKATLSYNIPLTDAAWIHQPSFIFNSLGFGQCDDLASALAYIWREMGYEVRIWNLSGHVVPEVFADGKWQMYDPSYDVYYYNEQGQVAGFEELHQNPELVNGKYGRLEIENFRNLAELNFLVLRYSDELKALYASGAELVTSWHLPKLVTPPPFMIPAGGSISFPVNSPSPVIISNWKGMKQQLVHYMRITIPKGWSGNFFCPLIISTIYGSGTLKIDKQTISLQNFALQFDLHANSRVNSFSVKEALTDINVYALINPGLFNIPGHNVVTISGSGTEHLKVQMEESEAPYPTLVNQVMDHRYQTIPVHFVRYELQKDTLQQLMFSPGRPLQSGEDICKNAAAYFSLWHQGNAAEKKDRTNDVCEQLQKFYQALPKESLKKEVLRFMSDPLAFIMLIYILEDYPEGTLYQMI